MTAAAKSAFYFGFYPLAAGVALLLAADRMLPLFGIALNDYFWPRLVGAVSMSTGVYYVNAGRTNNIGFIRWSVFGRAWVVIVILALVVLGLAKPALALFTLGDAAGLAWSWLALRGER
ncbi:MAG: hypothetical protein WAT58_00655 [Candidatus Dormiibacterota bacterium]